MPVQLCFVVLPLIRGFWRSIDSPPWGVQDALVLGICSWSCTLIWDGGAGGGLSSSIGAGPGLGLELLSVPLGRWCVVAQGPRAHCHLLPVHPQTQESCQTVLVEEQMAVT